MSGDAQMKSAHDQQTIRGLFESADVCVDGNRPWDIQVHTPAFFPSVLAGGSLALGESYMDGWWDCEALDQFFYRIMDARLDKKARTSSQFMRTVIRAKLTNAQRKSKAYKVAKHHYDIGNDLFSIMLDRWLNYSCGYWARAATLDEAQIAKLDLVCRKIGLESGMRILDIGCGWGGFAKYAAKNYGVNVVGITVSSEQVTFANTFCRGLPVEIRLQDYRSLDEEFDGIVSIGMFEHVGFKNYRTYMNVVHRCLAPGGLFLLHTIAGNTSTTTTDAWLNKYIFPDSMLPSAKQINAAVEGLFVLEDWHSFGQDYDPTLMAWHRNFTSRWDKIKNAYDQRFYRMWTYYLLSCAGAFRSRRNQLWQMVFSKTGIQGGYQSIR